MKSKAAIIILSTILLVLASLIVNAQDHTKPDEIKSLTKVRLTFFGVGLEHERKISAVKSIYVGASFSTIFPFEDQYLLNGREPDIPTFDNVLAISPVFYTGFRKYYNITERKVNGKKTINNSANYTGFKLDAILPTTSINRKYRNPFAMSVAAHWGIQRSLSEKVNFELALGPALKTDFTVIRVVPFSKVGFSFLL